MKELGADDVPNELFPQGIRVMYSVTSWFVRSYLFQLGYFYNFCGFEDWTFSGQVRQGHNLCCKVRGCGGYFYKICWQFIYRVGNM